MANPGPSELARSAQKHSEALRTEFELLKQLVESNDLPGVREQMVRLDERVAALQRFEAEIRRIGTLEDRVNKLEKRDEEAGKRGWQFVYIVVGAALALVASFAVQLVFYFLKK